MATKLANKGYKKGTPTTSKVKVPKGKKIAGLSIIFNVTSGEAVATWNANGLTHISGYSVLWYYKASTTAGEKWIAASGSAHTVSTATDTYSVPEGALAVKVSVTPVSKTYTYKYQTKQKKQRTVQVKDKNGKTKSVKQSYWQWTQHQKTVEYWKGSAVTVSADTSGSQVPETPTIEGIRTESRGSKAMYVYVGYSSDDGDTLTTQLRLYTNGHWTAHDGWYARNVDNGDVEAMWPDLLTVGNAWRFDMVQQNTLTGAVSDPSPFSDIIEAPPRTPGNLEVRMLSGTVFSASWEKQGYTGDSFKLRWAQDPDGITADDPPEGVNEASTENTVYTGTIALGGWYFTVRAEGDGGDSEWVAPVYIMLGMTPSAPTLSEMPPYVERGGDVTISWTYNNADGSAQAAYEVQRYQGSAEVGAVTFEADSSATWTLVDDVWTCEKEYDGTVKSVNVGSSTWPADIPVWVTYEGETVTVHVGSSVSPSSMTTEVVSVDVELEASARTFVTVASGNTATSTYTEAVTADRTVYRVRTRGVNGEWSPYSETAEILAADPVSATISVSGSSTLPIIIGMEASTDIRLWHLLVSSTTAAQITGPDGNDVTVPAGTVAFDGILQIGDEGYDPQEIEVELDLTNAYILSGVEYNVKMEAVSSFGLSGTAETTFTGGWDTSAPVPEASIPPVDDDLVAHIFPVCYSDTPTGEYDEDDEPIYEPRDDVTLSVYRIDVDGTPLLIADNIPNDGRQEIIDLHPNFGTCWYRIGAQAQDSSRGFYDIMVEVDQDQVVIEFDDGVNEYSPDFQDAGYIELPWAVETTESYEPEAELPTFAGNSDPTLYTGTQKGRKVQMGSKLIYSYDDDVLEKVRRLAGAMTRAYYRDPSGLGFWAWVVPTITHPSNRGPESVTFEITRITGDYSGQIREAQ